LTQDDILKIADERAYTVANYFMPPDCEKHGQCLDPQRIISEGMLPPEDHWETNDSKILEEDRFVEFVLEPIKNNGR
jgi:hypothetical protein